MISSVGLGLFGAYKRPGLLVFLFFFFSSQNQLVSHTFCKAPSSHPEQQQTNMSHPENTNLAETFAVLSKSDAKVNHLFGNHFSKPASAERVNAAKAGLEKTGFKVHVVNTRADAFETLKQLIPAVSVMLLG